MHLGPERPTRLALVARWLGVFAALVLAVGMLALRFGLAEGTAGPAVILTACVFAIVAIVLAVLALIRIWVVGHAGVGAAFLGLGAGLVVLAAPAYQATRLLTNPALTQVSTDVVTPPPFERALAERPRDAPQVAAIDERTRTLQAEHYPDVAPLELEAPPPRVFAAAEELIAQRRWRVIASQAPLIAQQPATRAAPAPVRPSPQQRRQPRPQSAPAAPPPPPPTQAPGRIEAVARTRLFGFREDVVLRFTGTATRTRVDMRSASRIGYHDLGGNARRITDFLEALRAKIEDE